MKPRIYQPERRFVQKAKAPGGISLEEAVRRADTNVAAAKDRFLTGVDEKLALAVNLAKGKDAASLGALRVTATEVGNLAGIYNLVELREAAESLRLLLSRIADKPTPWAAIGVHVDAMVSLRRADISGEANARKAVLEGLRRVTSTIKETGDA
jgi:hypothetical protein